MRWLYAGVVVTVLQVMPLAGAAAEAWQLNTQDAVRDIKVYTRHVGDSPLREFKGVTHIRTEVNALVALLRDADAATRWMHNVTAFEVVASPSATENVVYFVTKTPWPVVDRDAYVRSWMRANAQGQVVSSFRAEPNYAALKAGLVRMPFLDGSWTFTPQANGMVDVVYQVHVNPGGKLPGWLVNSIVVETPLQTLRNLQGIIHEPQYQGKRFAFIEQATHRPKHDAGRSAIPAASLGD